jgi:putative flippase GtrA
MWLPLSYLATGMLAWVLAAAAVPVLASHLVADFDDPKVFALTHLMVLGWVTMTIMGALYQLFPVALQASLAVPAVGRWNFIVYAAGVAGFVPSFYLDWAPGVAIFGSLTVVGIIIFAITLLLSYPSIRARHPMGPFVLSGLGWLIVVIGFGLTWALDWQFAWFNVTSNLLAAHVHAGLVGWLGCTLMGVSYKLMELFALAHRRTWRLAYLILGLWNAALAVLILSLLLWPGSEVVAGAAIALGATMLLFTFDLARMWSHRRRRRISVEQGHIAMSLLSLLLACGIGITVTLGRGFPPNWFVAYGYAAIVGGFGFAIAGRYQKIIPFLSWLHRYSRGPGPTPPPLLQDLVDERLGWASLALLTAGYVAVLTGLLDATAVGVEAGGLVYLAGALLGLAALRASLIPSQQLQRSASRPRLPGGPTGRSGDPRPGV